MRIPRPSRLREKRRRLANTLLVAVLLLVGVQATAAEGTPTSLATLAQGGTPGCFIAEHPGSAPREIPCTAPSSSPSGPAATTMSDPAPMSGSGDDVVAKAPTGHTISEAIGSFELVTNVSTVTTTLVFGEAPVQDAYTLQMNTNYFTTDLCPDESPACKGWQQFVFSNDPTRDPVNCRRNSPRPTTACGELKVVYWLVGYSNEPDAECPTGWTSGGLGAGTVCRQDGPSNAAIPYMPLTTAAMPTYRLTGSISGADVATFFDGTTTHFATGTGALDAGQVWDQVEFNVFGLGIGTANTANFNNGADFHTRTRLIYPGGALTKPRCVDPVDPATMGMSSELNNLNFVEPNMLVTGPAPAILFHQRKIPDLTADPPTSACASARAIGDTHERTFAGLAYDFQATGDFVEAQVGSAFEVQTRKISGAPTWPNTSMNRSVATRMGTTQVAVCDAARLVVNGVTTSLAPGGSLSLPTGVDIHRDGNAYLVRDQSGNSVRVTGNLSANPIYTDVEIGLGTWPTPVRGLLGNPDNDPRYLEARDGTRFAAPISFNDLYGRFGPSWRVAPIASLLTPCSPVTVGIPSAPFHTGNVPSGLRAQGESTCRSAGVVLPVWLNACILDFAVLGARAVPAFIRRQPAHDGNTPPCSSAGCSGGGGNRPR